VPVILCDEWTEAQVNAFRLKASGGDRNTWQSWSGNTSFAAFAGSNGESIRAMNSSSSGEVFAQRVNDLRGSRLPGMHN